MKNNKEKPMYFFDNHRPSALAAPLERLALCALLLASAVVTLNASEGGVSVYPAGVETILPGMTPGTGGTMFLEFSNFYQTNELADAKGDSLIPGFHLRVGAVAAKIAHNWGVHFLGGELVSAAALPLVYEHLNAPFGTFAKTGFGNPDLAPAVVAYHKADWHWWYSVDVFTPGFSYNQNDVLNVGQHNVALAPDAAFTYLPDKGRTEISSKFLYIVNYANPVTNYRSGNEFVWEYAGMHHLFGGVSAGVNGYFYQQTTDDRQNGLVFENGNRGRDFAVGPEIRCHFKHYSMILKYEKEMLAENKTMGNSFWLQFGVPLGHPGHD
jgi:hypothetical protein